MWGWVKVSVETFKRAKLLIALILLIVLKELGGLILNIVRLNVLGRSSGSAGHVSKIRPTILCVMSLRHVSGLFELGQI